MQFNAVELHLQLASQICIFHFLCKSFAASSSKLRAIYQELPNSSLPLCVTSNRQAWDPVNTIANRAISGPYITMCHCNGSNALVGGRNSKNFPSARHHTVAIFLFGSFKFCRLSELLFLACLFGLVSQLSMFVTFFGKC